MHFRTATRVTVSINIEAHGSCRLSFFYATFMETMTVLRHAMLGPTMADTTHRPQLIFIALLPTVKMYICVCKCTIH